MGQGRGFVGAVDGQRRRVYDRRLKSFSESVRVRAGELRRFGLRRADGGGGGRDTGDDSGVFDSTPARRWRDSPRYIPTQDGAYFAAKCTAHPREEGGTVFLIRIGHDEAEEKKEPELVEMRPVLPLADRALA